MVIVLDLMLPGMSGMELCRRLRQENQTHRVPIIMLTAKTSEADRIAASIWAPTTTLPNRFRAGVDGQSARGVAAG